MAYGLSITRDGVDLATATIKDYVLETNTNMWKLALAQSYTMTVEAGVVATYDIVHNLGYKPLSMAYFQHPENGMWYRMSSRVSLDQGVSYTLVGVKKNLDENTLQIRLYDDTVEYPNPSPPALVPIKVLIAFEERDGAWFEPAIVDGDNDPDTETYGFKVSRPGIDVSTAEPRNRIYDSRFKAPQFYRCISVPYDSGRNASNPYVVAHGLDYPPAYITFITDPAPTQYPAGRFESDLSGVGSYGWLDETNFVYISDWEARILLLTEPLDE